MPVVRNLMHAAVDDRVVLPARRFDVDDAGQIRSAISRDAASQLEDDVPLERETVQQRCKLGNGFVLRAASPLLVLVEVLDGKPGAVFDLVQLHRASGFHFGRDAVQLAQLPAKLLERRFLRARVVLDTLDADERVVFAAGNQLFQRGGVYAELVFAAQPEKNVHPPAIRVSEFDQVFQLLGRLDGESMRDAIRLEQIVQAAAVLPHARKHDLLERHACVRADEHLARRACFYAIRQSRRLPHDEGVRLHRIAELYARGERCPQPGDSVVKNLLVEKVQRRRACIQRVLQRCVVYHHRSALSRFAGSPCDSRSIARSTFPFLFSGMLGTFAMRVGLMKAGSNDAARPGSSFSQAVPS